MKQLFAILFISITTYSSAQTKLIAFKSHSGNMDNFSIALGNELFDNEGSNFGAPTHSNFYRLDSVIYVSSSMTILIKKKYQYPWGGSKKNAKLISVKKDTLRNSPLFSKKHSLDSIRLVLKNSPDPEYENPISKVVFVGYDNKKNKEQQKDSVTINPPKENNIFPIVPTGNDTNNDSPFDAAMAKALVGIFLLALLGGWLSSMFYKFRLQKA